MKTTLSLFTLIALGLLAGCGDDEKKPSSAAGGSGGEAGEPSSPEAGGTSAGASAQPEAGAPSAGGSAANGGSGGTEAVGGTEPAGDAGMTSAGGSSGEVEAGGAGGAAGAGGAGEEPPLPQAYYECQGTDQAFVRRAIQGVLGRRAYSQAEVNMYTDLIAEIDTLDAVDPEELAAFPEAPLRHSRKVFLSALFQHPDYLSNWEELYRDFLRVQRYDEYNNAPCYAARVRFDDAEQVAAFVRDNPAGGPGDGGQPPTMGDIVSGALQLDDISPMYSANLFSMVAKTYAGANGVEIESEIGRRRDFGAWFDAVYLNRDTVCLQCHNSEFSVTQTPDEATNRHYPVPALLEKALFGYSTGVPADAIGEPVDRMHGALKYARFVTDCRVEQPGSQNYNAAVADGTIQPDACPDGFRRCRTASSIGPIDWICESTYLATRSARPWNWATACGTFTPQDKVPLDLTGMDTKFGNVTGLRASMWDMQSSLQRGFAKLKTEGLGADPDSWEVADPDKAFAYLTSMNIVEKVWKEVTGTGLTIQTYYPRNAVARDMLVHLTETFVTSGYSNQALLEAIFASPFLNLAAPDSGCWENAYSLPRIFDPWVTAEETDQKRNNSVGDGTIMLSGRSAARAAYGSLGWRLSSHGSMYPTVSGYGENSATVGGVNSGAMEKLFQQETGYFTKNTEVGFRGFDFQARMGWEDRFGRCGKLAPNNFATDVIDLLATRAKTPGAATVGELVDVLKDRIFGTTLVDEAEQPLLEEMLGASLDADASTLADPQLSLRRTCGVMIASPQALTMGIAPPDSSEVPRLTPKAARYEALCTELAATQLPGLDVTCNGDEPLTVAADGR
jgi:hypothetical protein